MQLNDNTFSYMNKVSSQIEGLTCALIVYIENAGNELESYHYEVFNKFCNEIRTMEIEAVNEVNREFGDIKDSIEQIASRIKASEVSKLNLNAKLNEMQSVFERLVIHSQNMREFDSDTENPYIPNATDEIYKVFSGYRKFLTDYEVEKIDDENDVVAKLVSSFYDTSVSIFENLFDEYDKLLQDLGKSVEEKRREAYRVSVAKANGAIDITKSAVGLAKTIGMAALGIKKKNAFDVIISGIGLCAAISETLEDITPGKKSIARSALKQISLLNDAIELVDNSTDMFGVGEVDSAQKLFVASALMSASENTLEHLSESGKLEVISNAAATTGAVVNLVTGLATGKVIRSVIKGVPAIASNGLGLVEAIAKYCEKNNIYVAPQKANSILHNTAKQLNDYNEEVRRYRASLIRGMPARKPKAPPFVIAKKLTGFFSKCAEKGVDFYEKHVEEVL